MIRSMTGFGEASEQVDGVHYALDIRSLNNRYFKATIRLPDEVAALEAELESHLRRRINRGSVTLTLKWRQADASAAAHVNQAALATYLKHLDALRGQLTAQGWSPRIELAALLAMPGVLQPPEETDLLARTRPIALRLADRGIDRLIAMREQEGRLIAEDLLRHRQFILDRLEVIRRRAPQVVDEYHARLHSRIGELMARAELKLNESDLIREVAVFAERSDIAEEISRLGGHLDQFEQIIQSDGQDTAGRTLDFLSQELLREANTIASKSNDVTISRAIVEVKGAIDRMKEQVQNVE